MKIAVAGDGTCSSDGGGGGGSVDCFALGEIINWNIVMKWCP